MTKKILMVLTSHDKLGNTGQKTGFWVEEFAAPYYAFIDAGVEVTLATPKGGQAPIDPTSKLEDFQTSATERFDSDDIAQAKITNTLKLSSVNQIDFDGVFYPGGHGPLWDLTDNPESIDLIECFLNAGKAVAAVCHASAALLNVKQASGDYAIKGKAVTGFSNSEEEAVQLTDVVPFLLEDELINRGGEYQKADDWNIFVVQDGLIITGQNPASSALTAEKLLTQLST
ncbi:MAG: type 1 glutamine amidotransferase domain-containing protein [Thalassotalea sp.]|nr:type 1 glutamine amidotransferase domain-containing protein [Thalassotalea sp.]